MNNRHSPQRWALSVGLGLSLVVSSVLADNVDNLSEKLIQLRGDVEELSAELSLAREEHKQRSRHWPHISCHSWSTSRGWSNYHLNWCPVSLNHYNLKI